MKHFLIIVLCILLLITAFSVKAQYKPGNVCYINNDRIYFQIDKRWSDSKKKEISVLFSLDSTLIQQAIDGKQTFTIDSITWQIEAVDNNIIELSKPVAKNGATFNANDVYLLDDNLFINPFVAIPVFSHSKKYGLNKFAKAPTVKYMNGIAAFYLPGYPETEQVYLSGSFNNWSTMQLPMRKTESGWEVGIELVPGKYLYKYIIDGKWMYDKNNILKEADGNGSYNSVFYCYNHVFELKGFTKARKVIVTGSFNGWKPREIRMDPMAGGWNLPLYLEAGTYSYKFKVDGNWMPDPANSNTRADADGNMNSYFGIGDTIVFELKGYNSAQTVILTGSFNDWSTNELVMSKTADGWELPYILGPGNYEYKFIVDGKWMPDPANPITRGAGDFINSCLAVNTNYTFILKQFTDANRVIVTGSFNGWNEESYQMIKKDGIWTYPVFLKPGKYTYKFIVDGSWLIDPANENWEENAEGTGNSVLWIEP
jgi:hypothetical protein